MQSSETVAHAVTLLAPLASGGAAVAQGVATRALGDLVSQRLQRDGHARAWQTFRAGPGGDDALRRLLYQAVSQDDGFRRNLETAVAAALGERSGRAGPSTINLSGSGQAQIGNRGDTITGSSRVATRGSSYHEGDVYNTTRNKVTHKKNHAGAFITLAIVAVLVVVFLIKLLMAASGSSLTASSTCQQFLNADPQTQQQALVDIAMSKGIGGFGSPLALPEIQYECSSEPTMTLGALVERDKGEF